MKKLLLALAALSLFGASTAQAQVAKPYVEVNASTSKFQHTDFRNDITYGVRAGLEAPINSVASLTVDGGIENFVNSRPTLNANVGLNGRLYGPFGIYGQAGILQTAGDTGYRLGTGFRLNLTSKLYARAGYQRDDYGHGAHSDAGTVALGFRF